MKNGEQFYGLLMRAYPPAFRREFGREMVLDFRDQCRDGLVTRRYWIALIIETASSAPRLWAEEFRDGFLLTELPMKLMAVLTTLVGIFETVNSLLEARTTAFGSRDPMSQLVLVLTIASGVVLAIAGLTLLVRGQAARTAGRIAAVGCLVSFAFMFAARPMMSIAATFVGIAFPLSLLAFLMVSARNTKRAPG